MDRTTCCLFLSLVFAFLVCSQPAVADKRQESNSGADAGRDASQALAGLEVGAGLEATLIAAEPMLLSPSNIDVDHLGRVWVCEVVNYRHFANQNNPPREEGDRILILEDASGDGTLDKSTVFYQGRDIDSVHGVCVLGNRAIVSANDNVFVLTDDDGDGRADRKDVLFTGIDGVQHDHGIHAFVFGPDGRLYFNFGNEGHRIKDADGNPIIDLAGKEVAAHRQPYQDGMVFRCNLDGSDFETLAWNFRNNWEVNVDSFGTLWQSDNDDDGNRGVRINFVMEFGNYGYLDEMTGAGWQDPRTGMHAEIPQRHWHLNDPGVVPNLLQTGAGSPTGICVYEGRLLPKVFWDQMIHCDAGPNVVRAYPVKPDGAGYTAETVNILEGVRDKWFRPTDVCVAPDGSLIIADWYDPGVGGHQMGDLQRGRLFRIAPPGTPYTVPKFDFSTPVGAVAALKNPNLATRYVAWTKLREMGRQAEQELRSMLDTAENPRHRARALWLLGQLPDGPNYIQRAVKDDDPDIRITALRLARKVYRPHDPQQQSPNAGRKTDVLTGLIASLVEDPQPQVRRECAIALRHLPSHRKPELWAQLASQHDGQDRWYLEALGIGAGDDWDACLDAWMQNAADPCSTPAGRDIVWRSRAARTPGLLMQIVSSESVRTDELARYMRAFDFLSGDQKQNALTQLAFTDAAGDSTFVIAEAMDRVPGFDTSQDAKYRASLNRVLDDVPGTAEYVRLVDKFNVSDRYPQLLALAQQKPEEQLGVEAIRTLLRRHLRSLIRRGLNSNDGNLAEMTARVLGNSEDGRATSLLLEVLLDGERPIAVRRAAIIGAARVKPGAEHVVAMAKADGLDENLKQAAALALHSSNDPAIKAAALELFPLPPGKNNEPLPPLEELLEKKGSVQNGRLVFNTTGTCLDCHVVNGMGKEVGPNLSEIGKKLSQEAMFQSVLFPNAGISHNYETHVLVTDSGITVSGLLISQTDDSISIKGVDGLVRTFQPSEMEELVKQDVSLMPADLQKVMTAQELVDVVAYMTTLLVAEEN